MLFFINRCWIFFSALAIISYFKLANRLSVYNIENLPKSGGVLIASNHISLFEAIIIPSVIISRMRRGKIFAPAKIELFKSLILGLLLKSWGALPVKRGASQLYVIRKIMELLKKEMVMFFPEGTRSKTGELGKGNRMFGRLLLDAKPVVVPVRIFGTEKILGVEDERPRLFHKIELKFGPPLDLEKYYSDSINRKEFSQKVTDTVMEAISAIH